MHAALRRHADENQIPYSSVAQQVLHFGAVKATAAHLVDDGIARLGRQFGNDGVARLATNQNSAQGRLIAYPGTAQSAAKYLDGRQVRSVGAMPFTRVDDRHAAR